MPPQLTAHGIKQLGTVDADAVRIEAQSLFNVSNLLAKAEAARVRREAQGISDRTEAAQPRERSHQTKPGRGRGQGSERQGQRASM